MKEEEIDQKAQGVEQLLERLIGRKANPPGEGQDLGQGLEQGQGPGPNQGPGLRMGNREPQNLEGGGAEVLRLKRLGITTNPLVIIIIIIIEITTITIMVVVTIDITIVTKVIMVIENLLWTEILPENKNLKLKRKDSANLGRPSQNFA